MQTLRALLAVAILGGVFILMILGVSEIFDEYNPPMWLRIPTWCLGFIFAVLAAKATLSRFLEKTEKMK
jgi:uncharacterized protein (DUF983 family)